MNDNPKCPYCGEEMDAKCHTFNMWDTKFYFECSCGARTPMESTPEAAYAAAMKRERAKAKNIGADYAEQDQFICSECGIHLQDWVRIDEDDYEDGVVHEYVFRFCPNCGRRIDDEPISSRSS